MKDSWLRAAFSDTSIVANLLLRLKHPPPPQQHTVSLPLPPSWGVRQPRSKQPQPQQPPPFASTSSTTTTTTENTTPEMEIKRRGMDVKESVPRRRSSPTTPLSWTTSGGDGCDAGGCSGGGSPSDEYESLSSFCCNPILSDGFRSKVSTFTETPSTTAGKRPKRKRTFAELKEEESSLLKERTCLKKELATMRITVKEHRSLNENLKRIKLDLHVETRIKSEANSVDDHNNTSNALSEAASSSVTRLFDKIEDSSEPDSQKQRATSQEQLFVLPDLNMEPEEDLAGMS